MKQIIPPILLFPTLAIAGTDCIDLGWPSVIEVERNSVYVRYSVTIDAKNECAGDAKVFIRISGKNFSGHELDNVLMYKNIAEGERETLTGTTLVSHQDAMNIRGWDVKEVDAYPIK